MTKDEIFQQFKTQEYQAKKESFADFLATPTIRLLISMLPPGERPEILETLLKEAFIRGWDSGVGNLSYTVIQNWCKKYQQ